MAVRLERIGIAKPLRGKPARFGASSRGAAGHPVLKNITDRIGLFQLVEADYAAGRVTFLARDWIVIFNAADALADSNTIALDISQV
jgi:hypothetical protein